MLCRYGSDPAFQVNPDPGFFNDQKFEKNIAEIFIYSFLIKKLQFTYP
jgi:hypothetical protein